MAKIGLPKGSGKWLNVREKSVKSQGILKWILSGNPDTDTLQIPSCQQTKYDRGISLKAAAYLLCRQG